MKKRLLPVFTFTLILVLAASCGKGSGETSKVSGPSAELLKKADSSIMVLGKTLKKALVTKMKTQGVDSAVAFCVRNAQKLTGDVNAQLKGFSVKRTSLKIRNPKNAPDEMEKKALKYFEEQIQKTGKIPEKYLQTFRKDGKTVYRLYKPLKIGKPCLQCHGEPDQIKPSVAKILTEHYPNDIAKHYKEGDFRGLFRSEFSE